jgi:hypothetical protein
MHCRANLGVLLAMKFSEPFPFNYKFLFCFQFEVLDFDCLFKAQYCYYFASIILTRAKRFRIVRDAHMLIYD